MKAFYGRPEVEEREFQEVFEDVKRLKEVKGFEGKRNRGKELAEERADKKYLRMLDEALRRINVSPAEAFCQADKDKGGSLTTDELKAYLRALLPAEEVSMRDLAAMLRAFDTDRSNQITRDEFLEAFKRMRNSALDRIHTDDLATTADLRGKFLSP